MRLRCEECGTECISEESYEMHMLNHHMQYMNASLARIRDILEAIAEIIDHKERGYEII